ncbi:MAG: GTP-binding protein [Candidatus Lokiarchaeota archaeon]|nr:GTP-binding protein [Candidatus Lokiarchaeota archaeon]
MYDATYKIIVFGDVGVGKTTLLNLTKTEQIFDSDSSMTIGVDFEKKDLIVDEKKVKLQIWHYGGGERFRFLLPTYVKGASGGLFMYDITNYFSLAHIDDWLSMVKKETSSLIPIVAVGCKGDLTDKREITAKEGINISKSRDIDAFIECSSKTGENVEEVFKTLTRLMLQRDNII